MKRCPECRRDYFDDTLLYCLDDGTMLLEGPRSLEPRTEIIGGESSPGDAVHTAETKVYASNPGSPASSAREKNSRTTLVVSSAAILLLIITALTLYTFVGRTEKALPRTTANIEVQRLTGDGKTREAIISPDGKLIAYIRTEGDERSIWIKQIATNTTLQIVKPGELDDFGAMCFSPDGVFLYFNATSKNDPKDHVYRVSSLGGTPTKAFENAYAIKFSTDGKQASFVRFNLPTNETSIVISDPQGSEERTVASRRGRRFFQAQHAWSPNNKTIAAITGDDTLAPAPIMSIFLIPVDGEAEPVEIGKQRWGFVSDIVWHPSGDSILIAATDDEAKPSQIWEVSYPDGDIRRITNNLNGHRTVSITADGKSIVTGEIYSRTSLWVSPDLQPENVKQITSPTADSWGFDWTPDGRIVYASDISGDPEIWIINADGTNAKQLTNDRIYKSVPVVSPDGRYIVYYSPAHGGRLERIDISGGAPTPLTPAIGADNPDISKDGKWVIFSGYYQGEPRIMRVPITGGEHEVITDYRSIEPRYSRDGTRFACFVQNETSWAGRKMAIVPAEGGTPIKVIDIPSTVNASRGPVWTPDDSGITLVIAEGEKQNLWLVPVDGGPGKRMTDFEVPGIARREYSRDGKRIAVMRAEGIGHAIMISGFR